MKIEGVGARTRDWASRIAATFRRDTWFAVALLTMVAGGNAVQAAETCKPAKKALTTPASATTLFNAPDYGSDIAVLGALSRAAHCLARTEAGGGNVASRRATQKHYARLQKYLRPLTAGDVPALAMMGRRAGAGFHGRTGIYTNGNGAALLMRSTDALFIAFRGVNDDKGWFPAAGRRLTADSRHWNDRAAHFALFQDLVKALQIRARGPLEPAWMKRIYVTGFGLGAAMAQAMLAADPFAGRAVLAPTVAFANPGYAVKRDRLPDGVVLVSLQNACDALRHGSQAGRPLGQTVVVTSDIVRPSKSHSMAVYGDLAERLGAEGIGIRDLRSGAFGARPVTDIHVRYRGAGLLSDAPARSCARLPNGAAARYPNRTPERSRHTVLLGGRAAEDFHVTGDAWVSGGAGSDRVVGRGRGVNHTIGFTGSPNGVTVDLDRRRGANGDAAGDQFTGNRPANIIGSPHGDRLVGNAGDNHLDGRAGADRLRGGYGADTFYFASAADTMDRRGNPDVIEDFFAEDRIDLSAIDADSHAPGRQAFTFIGDRSFSGKPGQLRLDRSVSGGVVLEGNTDRDRKPELKIALLGQPVIARASLKGIKAKAPAVNQAPPMPAAPSGGLKIRRLVLKQDGTSRRFKDNDTIDLALGEDVSIRAFGTDKTAAVRFYSSGVLLHTDTASPFKLTIATGLSIEPGDYELRVVPVSGSGATGNPYVVRYDVVAAPEPAPETTTYPDIWDINTVPLTAPDKPALSYLGNFDESYFGTRTTRISQTVDDYHHYSKNGAWNADMSLIKLHKSLLDPETYQVIDTIDDGSWRHRRRWSHTDPNIIYSTAGASSSTGALFQKYDVVTKIRQTIADYSGEFHDCNIGINEGNLSNDDRYAPLACATTSTSGYDTLVIVDAANGQEVSRMALAGLDVDWLGMSQSGQYLVMKLNGATHQVYDRNLTLVGDVGNGSHADLGMDENGTDYLVSVKGNSVHKAALPNGAKVAVLTFPAQISGHISCRNIQRPGYCYYSLRKKDDGFHDISGSVLLDGANASLTEVFSYTRSTGLTYRGEPKGTVSPDGSRMIFASDWMDQSGSVYSYVTEIPQ